MRMSRVQVTDQAIAKQGIMFDGAPVKVGLQNRRKTVNRLEVVELVDTPRNDWCKPAICKCICVDICRFKYCLPKAGSFAIMSDGRGIMGRA